MNYEIQTHALIVKPTNEPIYSDMATIVRIDDEAAGPYVAIEQHGGKIAITDEEWPAIRDAIDRMMLLCQPPRLRYRQPGYSDRQWDGKGEKPEWMREWIAAGNDPMDCLVA